MPLTAIENGHKTLAWLDRCRDGATNAIGMLKATQIYGHFGKQGTLLRTEHWRIDRQKSIAGIGDAPGKSNLQLQRNIPEGPSTVACLIVPDAYLFDIAGPDGANRDAELTRVIRYGLNSSLESWVMTALGAKRGAVVSVFEISGSFSSRKPEFVSPQKPVK